MTTELDTISVFPTFVYAIEKPEFLNQVRKVVYPLLENEKIKNQLYPVKMSGSIEHDPHIYEFSKFTATTAGNILTDQGYKTDGLGAFFESMWCQEHHMYSNMDQHTHPSSLMVGFYFLDVPENSSVVTFFDPRAGKVATPLDENDPQNVTYASNAFHMFPKPGLLILSNSWLPHAFTKHGNKEPIRFVHFNIGLTEHKQQSNVEII